MHRRSFLGSAIGIVVSSQLPFIAEPARTKVPNIIERIHQSVELFRISEKELYNYRFYVSTDRGIKFWAPAIQSAIRDYEKLSVDFKCEDIKVSMKVTMSSVTLCTPDRKEIRTLKFVVGSVPMIPGDVLRVIYTLQMPTDW